MFGLFKKKTAVVGLDIGSSCVKAIQLEPAGKEYRIMNFGIASLVPEAIVDGEIMDREVVIEAIKSLFENNKFKIKEVATSIGRSVICKMITLDKMSETELRNNIQWEAEQHIPFDIEEVYLDVQKLYDVGDKQMAVTLVAAKKDAVNARADLIREAGLNPIIMDVDAYCVQNVYEVNYGFNENEIIAMVNIGASVTSINIVKQGYPYLTKDTPVAGNSFIEAFKRELSFNDEQSQSALKGEEVSDVDRDTIVRIVEKVAEELSINIERSISYARSLLESGQVSKIVLSGGSAKVSGLTDFLNRRHNVPIEIINPFQKIEPGSIIAEDQREVTGPLITTGLGLALRNG
jgi:type IV pilus assembly protein PilM